MTLARAAKGDRRPERDLRVAPNISPAWLRGVKGRGIRWLWIHKVLVVKVDSDVAAGATPSTTCILPTSRLSAWFVASGITGGRIRIELV
jgi:hypothetical protein